MAVKATLAYGKNFHFYQEALDNNFVYLELEDAPYDIGYRRIMIAIPIDVWETIRGLGAAHLDLVNTSDEDLIALVNHQVDERIAQYEQSRGSNSEKDALLRFSNSAIFGAADEAREQQIMKGIDYYKTERERQRQIVSRMAQHKIIEVGSNPPEI
jgi:hypothetical protein